MLFMVLVTALAMREAHTPAAACMETPPDPPGMTATASDGETTEAAEVDAAIGEAGEEDDEDGVLEGVRRGLYTGSRWLVENVDSWFGDRPFEEGGRVSGFLRIRFLYREDDGFDNNSRFKLRARMPNVSQRGYVFIGRDNEQELVRDESEQFSRQQLLLPESRSEDQTFFVGIGRAVRDNVDLRLGVRGGYKVFAQARYRDIWWLTDASNMEYRQTVFLAVDDGLGTTTGLNYAHAFSPQTALRWSNSATFGTETDGVEWSTSLGPARDFGRQRQLSLEVLANGGTDRPVDVSEYGVRSIWSQPIYRDWVIGDLIVGYFWPRDDDDPDRREAWAVGLGVDLRF